VPGRKSGNFGSAKNTYGGNLANLRQTKGLSTQVLVARLQRYGWDVGEDTITNIETGRRILSDSELVLILKAMRASPLDLTWPPK